MYTLIFAEIIFGFKRIWKLYLTNMLCILFIILLFAYVDGSRRQLNLQKTVFSGEIIVKMNVDDDNTEQILQENIQNISYIAKKIRSQIQYRLPANNNTGTAEVIGVDLQTDKNLADYITLNQGNMLNDLKDILIPTSIWQKTDVKLGDIILVMGKTTDKIYNAAPFKVCGFYDAPGFSLFDNPRFLIHYRAMEEFYLPNTDDIEYSIFFKEGNIPQLVNSDIRAAFNDTERTKVKSVEAVRISMFDLMNISVQMGIFLTILIFLTIIVVITIVMLVNFNVYLILFRKRQKQLGTLMTFGVSTWKIGFTLLLESFFQIVISTMAAVILALIISFLAREQLAGGFLEVMFVLLSGTNRIDFFIQFNQIATTFSVVIAAVCVAQVPIFIKVLYSNPVDVISGK